MSQYSKQKIFLMRYFFLLLITSGSIGFSFGQIDQPSLGAGYSNFTFYALNDMSQTAYTHNDWDIAFSTDAFGSGIFVNEGVGLSFTGQLPVTELYLTESSDFDNVDTSNMVRIYNQEITWEEGAFNHVKDDNNPSDYGWGDYDFTTHVISGTRLFVIHLKNGDYKKLFIESLSSSLYTFKYANLDGSDLVTETIDKSSFDTKNLVYYSFEEQSILDLEPENWDMLFTRYTTPLDNPSGGVIEYTVTGVLTNKDVLVAQADGIDPDAVDAADYEDEMGPEIETIGWDWKEYTGAWTIAANRVYFLKNSEGLWKIQFLDFEGSSTGTVTINKTFLGSVVNMEEIISFDQELIAYPNPAQEYVNIALELPSAVEQAEMSIINSAGQAIANLPVSFEAGLNVKQIKMDYPAGLYQVIIYFDNTVISKSILKQ